MSDETTRRQAGGGLGLGLGLGTGKLGPILGINGTSSTYLIIFRQLPSSLIVAVAVAVVACLLLSFPPFHTPLLSTFSISVRPSLNSSSIPAFLL
ncbi:hypothetical protein LZ554_005554 [Drepanopeziza brunnea f. sp. 'monogermtubi']|nr:hypothetical protein LZ554_005554 [Drepanopeziza brunnea f. sp. 'monogermtubi']